MTEITVRLYGHPRLRPRVDPVLLGFGELVHPALVLPDERLRGRLANPLGPLPTLAVLTWPISVDRESPVGVDLVRIKHTAPSQNSAGPWGCELARDTTAPFDDHIPEGASPATAWCFLFPWLSFCRPH